MILKPKLITKIEPGHRFSKGLVGSWLFNEGDGDLAYDTSGNGNHGTLIADTKFTSGKFGPALEFDGNLDNVDCGTEVLTEDWDEITIVGWAYIASSQASHVWGLGATAPRWTADTNGWHFGSSSASDKRLSFSIEQDIQTYKIGGLIVDEWHQYAVRYSNSQQIIQLFRDGVLIKDGLVNGSFVSVKGGNNLTIGMDSVNQVLKGKIDNVTIWNRALSAGEIFDLNRDPFQMYKRNL